MYEYKYLEQFNDNADRREIQTNKEFTHDDCLEKDLIGLTTENDENVWSLIIDKFESEDPYFDYNVTEIIISNSIKTIETSEQNVIFKILYFIFLILQKSIYVKEIFDNTPIISTIGSIIEDLESDIDIKYQSFNILDTYLLSITNENNYEIGWANNLIDNFNTLIINSDEKNPFFSTILQNSKILFEKGAFTNDNLQQNFEFYLSIINHIQPINLTYGIQNFEVILNRLPSLPKELYDHHYEAFEFIFSLLSSSKYPIIVQSSINILAPIIPLDFDYFLNNDFIRKCLMQIQNNNSNKDLAFAFTKSMVEFCSMSYEACNQLILQDFLRRKDLIQFGYSIQANLIQIIKYVIEKTKITFDQFIIDNFYLLFNSFIFSDDPSEIETVLDTLYLLHRYDFPFNEDLISNISILTYENEYNNSNIIEKATLIIQELKNNENELLVQ